MFGWLRRKKNIATEAQALEAEFDAEMQKLATVSGDTRAAVAYGVALSWRMFNAEFGSAEAFQNEPRRVQIAYAKKLVDLREAMMNREPEIALGIALTTMCLAPLIERNSALVNRMAEKLEPLNREGSVLQGVMPLP
jgi:hypothetical protein